MTLPFGEADETKGKRKFRCFCCGREYLDFDEYKTHIIDNHEEGRDYVLCPLGRCRAPVRNVVQHFRTKHPSEKLPKAGMLRAMVWRDYDEKGKCKKVKGPKNKKGWHDSTKMGKQFFFRSGWEKTVYEYLDIEPEVLGYKAEPFEIPYVFKGEGHKYTPDIFVSYIDGRIELWEIKPANQTLLEQNTAKWTEAEAQCLLRGWKFRVVTEVDIEKFKKKMQRIEAKDYECD